MKDFPKKDIDFLCTRVYNLSVHKKRGDTMSPRTGRPKAENPKDIQLKIRADRQTIVDLDHCCKKKGMNRSDIIRLGIQKVKQEVDKEK